MKQYFLKKVDWRQLKSNCKGIKKEVNLEKNGIPSSSYDD